MARKIPISPVVYSLKLGPSEGGIILYIFCKLGIMGALVILMLSKSKLLLIETQGNIPTHSLFFPIIKPLIPLFVFRANKKFKLHLFKLTASISKIARRYFISKGFPDLCYSKGDFNPGR